MCAARWASRTARSRSRRPAIGVQSPAFRLSRHTFASSCDVPGCLERARYGTILRVASPRKTKLRVRITDPAERTSSVFTIPVPSGVSYTRLFADVNEPGASTGTRRIDLKGVFQGHTRVARFVVTLVPMCPLKSGTRSGCPPAAPVGVRHLSSGEARGKASKNSLRPFTVVEK